MAAGEVERDAQAQLLERRVEGVEPGERPFHQPHPLRRALDAQGDRQQGADRAVDTRVVGRQRQGAFPRLPPELDLALHEVRGPERELDVGVGGIELGGPAHGLVVPLPGARPVAGPAVDRVLLVGAGEEVPRAGEARVELERLLQEPPSLGNALLVVPAVGPAGQQEVVPGAEALRRAAPRRLLPLGPDRPVVAGERPDQPGEDLAGPS